MFQIFSKNRKSDTVPEQIYGIVVARARDPLFFTQFGLPDTVMGRFELLALHIFLFSRRMKQQGSGRALELSQAVFDLFVQDVERALRELGIGDTSVPKRKKKMIRSFYGQIEDFDAPLTENDTDLLADRLNQRFYESANTDTSNLFASYVSDTSQALAAQDFELLLAGRLEWGALTQQESC